MNTQILIFILLFAILANMSNKQNKIKNYKHDSISFLFKFPLNK